MSLRCTFIDHGKGGAPDCMRVAERDMEAPVGRQVLIEVACAEVETVTSKIAYAPEPDTPTVSVPVSLATTVAPERLPVSIE